MEHDLTMTREAVRICTPQQFETIKTQLGDYRRMRVFIDFSLPDGYLYFIRSTESRNLQGTVVGETVQIHGGISKQGQIST